MSRSVLATHVYTSKELLDERLQNVEDSPLAEKMSEKPDLRLATDLLEGIELEEQSEAAGEETKDRTKATTSEKWWNTKDAEPEPEQSIRWWERNGRSAPRPVQEAAARQERERTRQEHVKKRTALARAKRERTKQEREEQQRLATGQWEREKLKKEQAATWATLEKVMRERAEREREERRQYAMAQAEAERRRKALLTQLFLVTSSVAEPRRTEAGNRDLLNSSITAMFSLMEPEAAIQVETGNPIAGYFLAELFSPPVKEEPLTLDAQFVSAEEGVSPEPSAPILVSTSEAERSNHVAYEDSRSNSPETVHASSGNFASSQSTSSSFNSSSSPPPDYTSISVSTYQPPVSAYTETQLQNMQMADYQYRGAAQTQASQQANPTTTYTITNQNF